MNKRSVIQSAVILACLAATAAAAESFEHVKDVIYGRKDGMALTMDVFQPAKPNGAAAIICISGGWVSKHENINPIFAAEFLKHGYTVFAVVHGSQPRYTIPDCVSDIHRAVRYIKTHAADYGIDPNRIGISGASAGGHLSLMLGCDAHEGNPKAADPVDRADSRVQVVGCFFPPTDFLNYGKPGVKSLGIEPNHKFKAPFDFHKQDPVTKIFMPVDLATREKICKEMSPIYHVTKDDAPTLILHGDADTLVPLQQSQIIVEKFKEAGVPVKLIVKEGAGHGLWPSMLTTDFGTIATWFDTYLAPQHAAQAAK
ncbi:MAG TPA: alpha/beta hydrolase [Pirellulales bacterium]|nr:alpha/beta hydrolase [Pirellulales bacterium]